MQKRVQIHQPSVKRFSRNKRTTWARHEILDRLEKGIEKWGNKSSLRILFEMII